MSWKITQKKNDEELQKIMNEVREQIVKHGGGGISSISRKFRIVDNNSDARIDLKNELPQMLKEIKVNLPAEQVTKLTQLLDRDRNGYIDYEEFLYHVAPPMSPTRIEWVNKVFDKLDKNRNGVVSKEDLAKAQNADARYNNLCRLCDKRGDGVIDRDELIDYYREISPSIDTDEYFITMLTNAWKL